MTKILGPRDQFNAFGLRIAQEFFVSLPWNVDGTPHVEGFQYQRLAEVIAAELRTGGWLHVSEFSPPEVNP